MIKIKLSSLSVLLSVLLVAWLASAVDSPLMDKQASVTIDTGARSIPYSPMIFGGFLEHFDHHFYCAVGDQGRVIALATSKDLRSDSK